MIQSEARSILEEVLSPLPLDDFFASIGRRSFDVKGDPNHPRAGIFGPDPRRTILDAYQTHSSDLDCHSVAATEPPPSNKDVADPDAFHDLIRRFHERDYTVRVPEVVPLSPPLQRFARALEFMLHQPVSASLFWSKAGAKAIVHYDNRDNLIIQLAGRKRWFISTDPPGLHNNWKHVGEQPPNIQRHRIVDVEPGDMIYVPRGLPHTVDSASESLHLAILFTPTTLRDSVIAAIDLYSDFDRTFREPAASRVHGADPEDLAPKVVEALTRLLAQCRSQGFVEHAMQHRSSRMIGDLPRLPKGEVPPSLSPSSYVAHAPLAICHLRNLGGTIDFSHPGEHLGIHEGAEPALRFIAAHSRFQIRDVPGLSDEVRLALVGKLILNGVLQPVA